MKSIKYRWMEVHETDRIGEIDRTEVIRKGYKVENGQLHQMDVVWDSPEWSKDSGHPHSIHSRVEYCKEQILKGGAMFGAFDDETLVGVGVVRWEIRPKTSQLAFLHISKAYRRKGIGDSITRALVSASKESGAIEMYVSATPSESAVEFYRGHGFDLTQPIPELYEEEPEDIHMVRVLC